jgi:methionine salvage enolase-phosphatase E1
MARPKKKDIVLSKESVLSLMQEIYNELVEQRTTAIRIQNKLIGMMNDPKNVASITGVLKEQQKIINDTIDKKLALSKLQSTIWEKSNNSNQDNFSLAEMDEDVIQALIQKDLENEDFDGGYKLH